MAGARTPESSSVEGPRPAAGEGLGRRWANSPTQGRRDLPALPGALVPRNAVDSATCQHCVTSGRTTRRAEIYHRCFRHILVDEYQDTNVARICGSGCWRRARRTSAASATTTSRSTAGAARKSATSCASRGFRRHHRAPSETTARRRTILAAASHLISHNEGRLGRPCGQSSGGRAHQLRGVWDGDEKPARSARKSRRCSATSIRSARSPSWCAPVSRPASSRSASSRWPALPVIGGRECIGAPRSATHWPIAASMFSPTTISPSNGSTTTRRGWANGPAHARVIQRANKVSLFARPAARSRPTSRKAGSVAGRPDRASTAGAPCSTA